MCNLIEYSDSYPKPLGSLWQYWRYEPALNNDNNIIGFVHNNNTDLFKFKEEK